MMIKKATAVAPSNVAFIKYWGKKDEVLRLPENGSVSFNLSNVLTKTTVEFNSKLTEDIVIIDRQTIKEEAERVIKHLDRIRKLARIKTKAKVVSQNNFLASVGLSSSASGFAALTVAGAKAAGLNLSEKQLSILSRQVSGSSCRSIPDGWVEWLDGDSLETSYAQSIFPVDWWDIIDIAVIVSSDKKEISSTEGQTLASSSPFYRQRLKNIRQKIKDLKKAIKIRDFKTFGEITEAEALELHSIMLTSKPALIYWTTGTLNLMKLIQLWRSKGLAVFFTLNTGQTVHLICEGQNKDKVLEKLKGLEFIQKVIVNKPGRGARIINKHLF